MTARQYNKISAPFRRHAKFLRALNFYITLVTYLGYPALLIFSALTLGFSQTIRLLLVPALSFAVVTAVRALYNAPRPYEVLDIDPLIKKTDKGHSFPSRHTFSIFVIATAFFYVAPPLGILFALFGCVLASIRVVAGVHFPRDVIAGAFIGVFSGVFGFYIL